jgi:hypothetical protein
MAQSLDQSYVNPYTEGEIRPSVMRRILGFTQSVEVFNHSRQEILHLELADVLTLVYCGGIGANVGAPARARTVALLRTMGFEIIAIETTGRYYLRDFVTVRVGTSLYGAGPGSDCFRFAAPAWASAASTGFRPAERTQQNLSPTLSPRLGRRPSTHTLRQMSSP